MSNLKCGTKTYTGPKCAETAYPECKDVGKGYKYDQLYLKGGKPVTEVAGKSPKYFAKFNQITKALKGSGLWSSNPLALGVCRVPFKKKASKTEAWYLYSPASSNGPQPQLPMLAAPSYAEYQEPEVEPSFEQKAEKKLKDLAEGYSKKIDTVKASEFDVGTIWNNFWKEVSGAAALIVLIVTTKIIGSKRKKKKNVDAEKRLRELEEKAKSAERKASAVEQKTGQVEGVADSAKVVATSAEKIATAADQKATDAQQKATAAQLIASAAEKRVSTEPPILLMPEHIKTPVPGSMAAPVPAPTLEIVSIDEEAPPLERPTIVMDAPQAAALKKGVEHSDTLDDLMKDGTQEPDLDMVETLLRFDPANRDLAEESDLRAIETTYAKKIPESVVKRAGLVARYLYKPEGVTFTEALIEILETACEKSKNGKVTIHDVREAAIELRIFDDLFDDARDVEHALEHVEEIEEVTEKKIPREMVWKARLIARDYYRPDNLTTTEAMTRILQSAAELAKGPRVARVDLVDAAIFLTESDIQTTQEAIAQLERVYDEQRIKNFDAVITISVESHSKWVDRKGYHLKPVDVSKGMGGVVGARASSASSPSRPTGATEKVDMSRVSIGDSVPGFRPTADGIEIPEAYRTSGKAISGVTPDAPTCQPMELPEEVRLEMAGAEAQRNAQTSGLEFTNIPQMAAPLFRSISYYKRAEAAIGRFVTGDSALKRVWGATQESVDIITAAFRTVLSEVSEEKANRYYIPEEDQATREGLEAAAQKQTTIDRDSAQIFDLERSTILPGDVEDNKARAMARDAIEKHPELKTLNAFEKTQYIDLYVKAIAGVDGFAEFYFAEGAATKGDAVIEGVLAAREFVKTGSAVAGAKGAKGRSKAESKKGAPKGKPKSESFDLGDMFKDGELDGIVDPKKPGK